MAKNFRSNTLFLIIVVMIGLVGFSACQDQLTQVKNYNNSIVQIQKSMLSQAQQASGVLSQQGLTLDQRLQTLEQIQLSIDQSHQKFTTMSVPRGGEQLSSAMENFFQVEKNGVQKIIDAMAKLRGQEGNEQLLQVFKDSLTQFKVDENSSLRNFYATQQQIAGGYGQKVINTGN